MYRLRLASVTLRERYDFVVATWRLNSPLEWPFVIVFRSAQRLFWAPRGRSGALHLCLSAPRSLTLHMRYSVFGLWHSSSLAAKESDECGARRLLFRRSELLGRPSLPSPWLSAHDAFGRTFGLQQILWLCFLGFFFFTFGLGLFLAQASLVILPREAGAAERASASL